MELHLHCGMQVVRRTVRLKLNPGTRLMELLLQFGYGMMDHCRTLTKEWGQSSTILSPRDLSGSQLEKVASDLKRLGGSVLVDPQFYLPHSDHHRLVAHEYWPTSYSTGVFWAGPELTRLLEKLLHLNNILGTASFILPALYAAVIDDDWLEQQRAFMEEAARLGVDRAHTYATVCLSDQATTSNAQIHELLENSRTWGVGGVYLICEHPRGDYLVQDPSWLANVLDLVAGFRLRGKKVILGYSNHQMLSAACAGATGLCSGTWMNVRSFPPDKFKAQYDEEMKQRTTWYYCPQAFSEFKLPYLDIAARQGVLGEMAPRPELSNRYASVLFSGVQPTTVGFSERDAFRHYLHCLRVQAVKAAGGSFDETCDLHLRALDAAEKLLRRLHSLQVRAQGRDFFDCIDANRAALGVLQSTRGPMLRRNWASL